MIDNRALNEIEKVVITHHLVFSPGLAPFLEAVVDGRPVSLPGEKPNEIIFRRAAKKLVAMPQGPRKNETIELIREVCDLEYTDNDYAKADFKDFA